jgi:hypothetical protein
MPSGSEVLHHRGRVGALARAVRAGERSQAELDQARADLSQARIAAYVDGLSDAERTQLAALLERT